MSTKVQLLVRDADENDVIPIIFSPESGFRTDSQSGEFRKPLKWGASETIALVGVVLSVAQLAVSIFQIFHKSPEASVELYTSETGEDPVVINGKDQTSEEIARQLGKVIPR